MFRKILAAILSVFGITTSGADGPSTTPPIAPADMAALKAELCGLAERVAREGYDTRLDYSVESIKHVERILASIHDDYKRTKAEDGLNGIAAEFAAYIVTVIERHYGPATWERDDPTFGPASFPLRWRGATVFPYSWCQKRIFEGPAEDVWSKFQALIINHESHKPK